MRTIFIRHLKCIQVSCEGSAAEVHVAITGEKNDHSQFFKRIPVGMVLYAGLNKKGKEGVPKVLLRRGNHSEGGTTEAGEMQQQNCHDCTAARES